MYFHRKGNSIDKIKKKEKKGKLTLLMNQGN